MAKKQLVHSNGSPAAWARELARVTITLHDSSFKALKISAIENNRSLSMEARTMIECALRAQKAKEYEH